MGLKEEGLWEIQWHPAGGGKVRRVVLTWHGLCWATAGAVLLALLVLAVVGALPVGLQGFLSSFTVEAAQRENRALRLEQDSLHERVAEMAARLRTRVQRGRKLAWVLGAPASAFDGSCPPLPPRGAGDDASLAWLADQSVRLETLGAALSTPHETLPCPLGALPFAPPVDTRREVPVSLFGWRVSPFTGKTMAQYGTLLAAPLGEPVLAPGAGKVLFAGSVRERRANEWTRFGNLVVLDHGGGVTTVFGHLRDVMVARGQTVTRGQRLGSAGQSGWTRVPAVYYEVRWPLRDGSRPVDPGLVTPALPVEDLDARLAEPTGDLPEGFAQLQHLVSARPQSRALRPRPAPLPAQ